MVIQTIPKIQTIPRITPKDLERILKHLPEPTYVEIDLAGDFDYSTIFAQAEEVMPGIKLKRKGKQTFELTDYSKEKILDVYRKIYEIYGKLYETGEVNTRRIDLNKIGWCLDNKVEIELIPNSGVNIKYKGQEPDYISKMRQELSGTNVRIGIEINK